MTLEDNLANFLDPNQPNIGLQREIWEIVKKSPQLRAQYELDPNRFIQRAYGVSNRIAKGYNSVMFHPKESQLEKAANSNMGQKFGEKVDSKFESRFKIPKGLGIVSLAAGIPAIIAKYGMVNKETGGDLIATGYATAEEIFRRMVPFSDQFEGVIQNISDLTGYHPLQRHIKYKLEQELHKEFNVNRYSSQRAANTNAPIKGRMIRRKVA